MKPKSKIVLATGLVLLCAGVWVPQIIGSSDQGKSLLTEEISAEGIPGNKGAERFSAAPDSAVAGSGEVRPSTSVPAIPKTSAEVHVERDAGAGAEMAADQASGGAPRAPGGGDGTDALAALDNLEDALGMIETFAPRSGRADLATILAALEAADASMGPTAGSDDPPSIDIAPSVPHTAITTAAVADLLHGFAAANPCQGIIYGDDVAMALLGHRVVREGDRLEGGRIQVLAIGPGWLRIGAGDQELTLDLPAFKASRRAAGEKGSKDEAAGGGGAPSSGGAGPGHDAGAQGAGTGE